MIDDEASIWLVRLDNGNLSDQSRKELKAWLSADKRHPVALKAMADIWDGMDVYDTYVEANTSRMEAIQSGLIQTAHSAKPQGLYLHRIHYTMTYIQIY